MRATEKVFKEAILGSVEDELAKLAVADDLTVEFLHYKRGVMFGQLSCLIVLYLITKEDMDEITKRIDNISKLKYQEIDAINKRVQRN